MLIFSLNQARIQQKEETIAKYQELLKQARDDMQDMNKRHEQDLKNMQLKIHQNTDAAFNKFKDAARDLMAKQQLRQPATEKQVRLSPHKMLCIILLLYSFESPLLFKDHEAFQDLTQTLRTGKLNFVLSSLKLLSFNIIYLLFQVSIHAIKTIYD